MIAEKRRKRCQKCIVIPIHHPSRKRAIKSTYTPNNESQCQVKNYVSDNRVDINPFLNRRSKLSSNAKQNNFKIRRFLRAHLFKNTKISPPPRGKEKKKSTNHSRYGSINRRSSQILQQQSRIRRGGWNVRRSCEGGLATWSRRNPQAPATSLPLVSRMIARRMLWVSIREREEKGRGRKRRRRRPTMRREDAEDEELAMVVAKSWRPGAL